ncbi:MAG: response regulator [Oscillospiraceae bacterium]|nr:response regulator [Oscillospiraceae bacterium]
MTEHDYECLAAEVKALRGELAQLKQDNNERIKCELISNAAMEEALRQDHPSAEINSFLASIGRSLGVDRIYIFEDDPEGEGTNNTYEWCAADVAPQIDFLQKVPFDAVTWWYDQFEKGRDIHIIDLEAIRDTEPITYSYLEPQGIHSLIAKRLTNGERIIGFFGVDNPRLELMADISSFLDTLSNFLASLIQNRNIYLNSEARHVAELEEKNIALNEALHRAEEASVAKSRFLSNMSHDIRTPLNGIIGMTSIAREHMDDRARVEDCLQKITVSGKHLLSLINDVLDMSKIESGKMTLTMEDVSLSEALDSVSTITRTQAKDRSQNYTIQIHDTICDRVVCDKLRLNQVLLNLLSNAIKYTPDGGTVTLDVRQEASSRGEDYVLTCIRVADTGIGMSPEFLKTIFDAFTREESTGCHKAQGTGLGMAITKRIVDAMGGSIEVNSELGHGSTFLVELDLKKSGDAAFPIEQQSTDTISLRGMRIILAEDNDINAEIATVILEENNASVTRCEDGLVAVRCFEASEPGEYNAILMDLRMPNMNGLEATKAIRALQRSDAETIPIIAMTADAFSGDVQKCMEAGMNAHVPKPIDIDVLKQTLVKLIQT